MHLGSVTRPCDLECRLIVHLQKNRLTDAARAGGVALVTRKKRLMSITTTANAFFKACETGKGWDGCKDFCHEGATFFCQADALTDTKTLADYADWMKGLLVPISNGRYELTALATDEARATVVAAAEFHGTHTGEGAPCPPTGKSVVSDFAYVMHFDGDKITHMSKIWNDLHALRALDWACSDGRSRDCG